MSDKICNIITSPLERVKPFSDGSYEKIEPGYYDIFDIPTEADSNIKDFKINAEDTINANSWRKLFNLVSREIYYKYPEEFK